MDKRTDTGRKTYNKYLYRRQREIPSGPKVGS